MQGLSLLQSKGILSYPVEEVTQRSNADGTNLRTVKAVLNTYKPTLPVRDVVYEARSVSPITTFTPASAGTTDINKDSHYQPVVSFDNYDNYGNIVQEHKAGDVYHSYIWGYPVYPNNNTYPIAEAINAAPADIAYTSFEADGTGNWSVASPIRDSVTTALTGTKSYNLANGALSKGGLTSGTTYVVSYWTKNSSPLSITGTVGSAVKGAAANGWTYYEHKVTGQNTITLSGTGNIDEVRLYPQNAEMTSYTYAPVTGVTTTDDARGIISYYDYDGFGRLVDAKDVYGNIVKAFQYHYQGQ